MKHHPGDKVRYTGSSERHEGMEGVVIGYMLQIEPFEGGKWPKDSGAWAAIKEDSTELIERGSIEI